MIKVQFLGLAADATMIVLERDIKNAKQEALRIDKDGDAGIVPGHGVTVFYPSGRKTTFRALS